MNSEMFKSIKGDKAKKLYEAMWDNNSIVNDNSIERSISKKNKLSHCSYSFEGDDKVETLINVFKIPKENKNIFRQKFAMACSGSGREYSRITTLHSSSLCALLFFYNVTEKNSLKIEGIGTFTKSVFEFRNPVMAGNHPSCMDVVLLGVDDQGEDLVLFIESKFSEYYMCAAKKSCEISDKYLYHKYSEALYEDEFLEELGICKSCVKDGQFTIHSDEGFYIDGIKQMISHYVGMRNCIDSDCGCVEQKEKDQDEIVEAIKDGAKVMLAEIIFDPIIGCFEISEGKTYKEIYAEKFKMLAEKMNSIIENSDFIRRVYVHPEVLGYSMFLKDNLGFELDEGVKEFYFRKV